MSTDEQVVMTPAEVVRAANEAVKAGHIDEALEFYDDEVVLRWPLADHPGFKKRIGKARLRKLLTADTQGEVKALFHHLRYVCEGDVVAVEGVNEGDYGEHRITQPVALFYTVAAERITSLTIYYDRLSLRNVAARS